MKRKTLTLALASLVLMGAACNKLESPQPSKAPAVVPGSQIVFSLSGEGLVFDATKATAVTLSNLTSFNLQCITGTAGSAEANAWSLTSLDGHSGTVNTGKYWPVTDPGYKFYASNAAITFAAAGSTVNPANCNTDWVVASNTAPTYAASNTLTFNHILARLGTVTLNTQGGYTLSGVTATLKSASHSGTYKLSNCTWTSKGSASDEACAAFSGSVSAQTSTNDIYVVPGSYTMSVSYTLTKGDYVQSFTKTGTITLAEGRINNITATAVGGSAQEITFSVSVTAWSNNPVTLTLS